MTEIFVFGSNIGGRHGMGAAFVAKMQHGAIQGQGEGLQGRSYGIPTKDLAMKTMSLRAVSAAVDRFLAFADKNPSMKFKVTAIGTGLAGYSHDDIGPLFAHAPYNCVIPQRWKQYMMAPDKYEYWNT